MFIPTLRTVVKTMDTTHILVPTRQLLVVARQQPVAVLRAIVVAVRVAHTHLPASVVLDRGRATMRLRAQTEAAGAYLDTGIVLILKVVKILIQQELGLRQIVNNKEGQVRKPYFRNTKKGKS